MFHVYTSAAGSAASKLRRISDTDIEEVGDRITSGEPIIGLLWDSLTETHRLFLENLVDRGVKRAASKGEHRDEFRQFQEDWGDMTEQMRRLLRATLNLPCHVGVSSLPRRDTDEESKVRVSMALNPALARDVGGFLDTLVYTRYEQVNGEDEYSGITRPSGRFDAKDALSVLPRRMANPTFPRLLAYFAEELTSRTDPEQQEAAARRRAEAEKNTADTAADTSTKE